MRTFILTAAAALLFVPTHGTAQTLSQAVRGGSVPGQITMRAGPTIPMGVFGVVFVSLRTLSIPLFPLDPSDPRSLGVGLELGSLNQFGLAGAGGVWDAPPLPIPNDPSFYDAALFFQSTYIPGSTYFVGPLSRVSAVRFGPAGQFRDRGGLMSQPRSFMPSVELPDGRVLLLGGGSGAILAQLATSQVDIYDPVTDQYQFGVFMLNSRSLHTATVMFDGRVFVCGGVDQSNDPTTTTEIYDPATGLFTPGPPMAIARMGHTATALNDGRILITGGLQDLNQFNTPLDPIFSSQNTTEIYDPFNNTMTAGPAMSEERAAHVAIPLVNGGVLLAGGIGFASILFVTLPTVEQTCDIYDPTTNSMATGPMMNSPRAASSMVEIAAGRILLAGGIDALTVVNQGTPTVTAEIYDEASNTFVATGSMAAARALHQAHPIGGGRFIHIGGVDGSVLTPNSLDSCEIYDAASGTFSAAPNLPTPLGAYGSYASPQGPIHIFGGSTNQIPGVVGTAFWYYP